MCMEDSAGATPTQQTIEQTSIPSYAKPYVEEMLGAARSNVFQTDSSGNITGFQPYQTYDAERIAQFTPLQQQAFESAQALGPSEQGIAASHMAQQAGLAALQSAGNPYQAGTFSPDRVQLQGLSPYQTGQFSTPQAQLNAMTPYQAGQFASGQAQFQSMAPYQAGQFSPDRVQSQSFISPPAGQSGGGGFGGLGYSVTDKASAERLGQLVSGGNGEFGGRGPSTMDRPSIGFPGQRLRGGAQQGEGGGGKDPGSLTMDMPRRYQEKFDFPIPPSRGGGEDSAQGIAAIPLSQDQHLQAQANAALRMQQQALGQQPQQPQPQQPQPQQAQQPQQSRDQQLEQAQKQMQPQQSPQLPQAMGQLSEAQQQQQQQQRQQQQLVTPPGGPQQPQQPIGQPGGSQQSVAQQYMSPYMQNVVDVQQREAQRQADIAGQRQQAEAVRAGAFGGGRDAIMRAEAARNLALQKGDIQAQGLQSAFQQAQAQFNADQARQLQASMANQQAGLTAQQLGEQSRQFGAGQLSQEQGRQLQASIANQQSGLTAQQLGEQSRQFGAGLLSQEQGRQLQTALANQQAGLTTQQAIEQSRQFGASQQGQEQGRQLQAMLANQQTGLEAQRLGEQSRQYGAGFGLSAAETALRSAGTLGQLGQAQFGQELSALQQQGAFGQQQQQQVQGLLQQQYQDFLNQQRYPYQQLGFMSDMLRGLPMSQTTQSIYQAPPSPIAQVAGLGTAIGGASGLAGVFRARGGPVHSSRAGLADLMVSQI